MQLARHICRSYKLKYIDKSSEDAITSLLIEVGSKAIVHLV